MNATAYELLATMAKYWFLLLMAVILGRLTLSVAREMRIEGQVQREIRQAGAGINATLVLLSDEEQSLRRGKLYAVEGETTLGRSRRCDVRLNSPSVRGVHCILSGESGGLAVVPVGAALVVVDGEAVQRRALAHDGSTLQIGGLVFRLRLEEGNEVV